ncbi:MAG: hypothetical protein QE271_12440 [Bacteriovoracaceae bacterium]|nr:hypothetical protein [Bacteriovoracaceae bacterium]
MKKNLNDKPKLFWSIFILIILGMATFLLWPKYLSIHADHLYENNNSFVRSSKNNPNRNNLSLQSDSSMTDKSDLNVQETLAMQKCGPFHHWNTVQDLKKDLENGKNFQLVWATWKGNTDGQKISWQFFLRPPSFTIVDSLFFILDNNDVPMKQEKIPSPFTNPIGQQIFDRIKILKSSFPDSHWQFALNFTEDKNQVTAMIWEENEGFTTCQKNQAP